jgi:hypothetical protein
LKFLEKNKNFQNKNFKTKTKIWGRLFSVVDCPGKTLWTEKNAKIGQKMAKKW